MDGWRDRGQDSSSGQGHGIYDKLGQCKNTQWQPRFCLQQIIGIKSKSIQANKGKQCANKSKCIEHVYDVQNHFNYKIHCKDWQNEMKIMELIMFAHRKCGCTTVTWFPVQWLTKRRKRCLHFLAHNLFGQLPAFCMILGWIF